MMQNAKQRIKNDEALTATLKNESFAIFFLAGHPRVAVKLTGVNGSITLREHDGSLLDADGKPLVGWYETESLWTWAQFNAEFQGFDNQLAR